MLGGGVLALVGAISPWRPGVVVGRSMEPTLSPGTAFLIDRSYYRTHPVRRGDIVVLKHDGETWIKRVFAAAGETFWTWREPCGGHILHEPIRSEQKEKFAQFASHMRSIGGDVRVVPLRLSGDQIFVVGDGWVSEDSREFGPVEMEEIVGRVVAAPGHTLGTVPGWIEYSFPGPQSPRAGTGAPTSS